MSSTVSDFMLADRPGAEWFRDHDGMMATTKGKDEVKTYTLDWSAKLTSGETISTVANTARGVTIDSSSNTSTVTTITISGTAGTVEQKITTSAGRVLVDERRFHQRPWERNTDYRV